MSIIKGMTRHLNESYKLVEDYTKYPRTRINFEDDIVIVYDGDKEIYKGLEDYEPMKDEDWRWDNATQSYVLGNYRKICLEGLNEAYRYKTKY